MVHSLMFIFLTFRMVQRVPHVLISIHTEFHYCSPNGSQVIGNQTCANTWIRTPDLPSTTKYSTCVPTEAWMEAGPTKPGFVSSFSQVTIP